jgi:hypothetical protein
MDIDDLLLYEDGAGDGEGFPRDYETPEIRAERAKDRAGRRARVLITVKTTPQPSTKYVDTVCVAGLASEATVRGGGRRGGLLPGRSEQTLSYRDQEQDPARAQLPEIRRRLCNSRT